MNRYPNAIPILSLGYQPNPINFSNLIKERLGSYIKYSKNNEIIIADGISIEEFSQAVKYLHNDRFA
jgi:hypothetical protein